MFPVPTRPEEITAGPDGNVWFTEPYGIGRVTRDGEIDGFPIAEQTRAITTGPDGRVWFSDGSHVLGRLAPDGRASEIPLSSSERTLNGLAPGPDGEVWFTADAQAPCVGGSSCQETTYSNPGIVGRVSIDPLSAAIARQGSAARPRLATLDVTCRGGDADGICRGTVAVALKRGGRRLAHHRLALKTDETRTFVFSFGRTAQGRKIRLAKGTRLIASARVGGRTARRVLVVH